MFSWSRGHGVCVVAWTHVPRRQQQLADLLDGDTIIVDTARSKQSAALRYLRAAVETTIRLWRRGPSVVIVSVPPIPTAVVVYMVSRLLGFRFLMDSHPGAFGLMGDETSRRLSAIHRFLVRRAQYVAVTTEPLAREVARLGGIAGLLHEPPPPGRAMSSLVSGYVFFPGSGGRDEPYELIFEIARAMPDWKFLATGSPGHKVGSTPSNLQLVGWVPVAEFERLLYSALAVLVLSSERESVMRTAYEACYALKPLVVSATPATERYFPHAIHVRNTPANISDGLLASVGLEEETLIRQREQAVRTWNSQFLILKSTVDRLLSP